MPTEVAIQVRDASSGLLIPVVGVDTADTVADPTTGHSIVQAFTQRDPSSAQFTAVDAGGNASSKSVAATPVRTTIAASVTVVTLLASNVNRRAAYIVNDSASATLNIGYGAAATLTDYTLYLLPGDELTPDPVCFTGIITGIWSAASGSARITEVTN